MKKVSKFLALILRHNPAAGDIVLDAEGWANVNAVLAAVRSKYGAFSRTELQTLVAECDKQRYCFNPHGDKIRANQGHSVDIDLKLEPTTPPQLLYHGTKQNVLGSILKEGLTKRKRQHVHLSADIETATVVASRRSGDNVILKVLAEDMAPDYKFYQSDNGVWLTDRVPPQYLSLFFD